MKLVVLVLYLAASLLPIGWLLLRGATDGASGSAWSVASARVVALVHDQTWRDALLTFVLQAGLAAGVAVALALPAAIAFTGWSRAGRRRCGRLLWLARIVPPVLVAVPLARLLSHAPGMPSLAKVALAHLMFHVPVAIWIVYASASRLPPALLLEARQDGLGVLARARHLWWPTCRSACALALLWCFAASFGERALTATLHQDATLATSLRPSPADAAPLGLPERAIAAVSLLPIALLWSALLGWWWTRNRSLAK